VRQRQTRKPCREQLSYLVHRGFGLQHAFHPSRITYHEMQIIPDNLHINVIPPSTDEEIRLIPIHLPVVVGSLFRRSGRELGAPWQHVIAMGSGAMLLSEVPKYRDRSPWQPPGESALHIWRSSLPLGNLDVLIRSY
jgi:hypothetical protein